MKRHRSTNWRLQHLVGVGERVVALVGPADIEVHRVEERLYIVDTARLFPPCQVCDELKKKGERDKKRKMILFIFSLHQLSKEYLCLQRCEK